MKFILHSIRIIYPLFKSLKVLKNKDTKGQNSLLKYWCINWMISLFDIILEIILNEYIVDIFLIAFAIVLINNNFYLSVQIFNHTINPLIYQNEKIIESFFNYIDQTVKNIFEKSSSKLEQVASEKIGEVVANKIQKK